MSAKARKKYDKRHPRPEIAEDDIPSVEGLNI